jgi:peroxiredoxin (alkyl hydroperoxide reductase subunit C)
MDPKFEAQGVPAPGIGMPGIGMPAPRFDTITTHGKMKLEDFKGSWLILFSHPADFTPVCTTEFVSFANAREKFKAVNCELLGLSTDSVYSHIAWIKNIETNFDIKIHFPIIADVNKEVARMYGMIMPIESKSETARCVFIIDDKQILRSMMFYPHSIGRNIDEIFRVVKALQVADKKGVGIPANWKPGDKVIVPAPFTTDMAESRMKNKNLEKIDWYFSKKEMEEV